MQLFITGTGTNIGKTLICSWLLAHTNYSYFKPIQTGNTGGTDSETIASLPKAKIYPEIYSFKLPVSPHLAALEENSYIDLAKITLPNNSDLIIEGAGGLLVPINDKYFIIDLIKHLNVPVILVASSELGTINHTLLSIAALRDRNIDILGVILSGAINPENCEAIKYYGKVEILMQFPLLLKPNYNALKNIPLPKQISDILKQGNLYESD